MKCLLSFVWDESGAVLSAEAALLGTVGVLGAVVGGNLFAESVNDELRDVAYSFRSLDQSYSVAGHSSPTAWTAGSGYTQEPVEMSLARMREREEDLRDRHEEKDIVSDRDRKGSRDREEREDEDRERNERREKKDDRGRDRGDD